MILPSRRLNKLQSETIVKQINRLSEISPFSLSTTKVFVIDLPFYQKGQFLDLIDVGSMPPKSISACKIPEGIFMLEYGSSPFENINRVTDLMLSVDNVCLYLFLYLKFLRLAEGGMQVVETLDSLNFREDLPPSQKKVMAQLIKPISVLEASWPMHVTSIVLFQTSLFKCTFKVSKTGDISLAQRELLLGDLPVLEAALKA